MPKTKTQPTKTIPKPLVAKKSSSMPALIGLLTLVTIGSIGAAVWFKKVNNDNVLISETKIGELQTKLDKMQSDYQALDAAKKQDNTKAQMGYELLNSKCDTEDCLFGSQGNLLGITTIKGYYSLLEKTDADQKTVKCDSFTITSSTPELTQSILNLIKQGNGIHSKNEENQPVVNLDFNQISPTEKQTILKSTKDNDIELSILIFKPREAGAPICFAPFVVLEVK